MKLDLEKQEIKDFLSKYGIVIYITFYVLSMKPSRRFRSILIKKSRKNFYYMNKIIIKMGR